MSRLALIVSGVLTIATPALAKISDAMEAAVAAANHEITSGTCVNLWNAYADNHNVLEALDNAANDHSRHMPATWESDYQEKADELRGERNELAVARADMLTWVAANKSLVDACVAQRCLEQGDADAFAKDIPYNERLVREEKDAAAEIRPAKTGLEATKDVIDLLTLFGGSSDSQSQSADNAASSDDGNVNQSGTEEADPSAAILNDTVEGLNKSANDWGELCITEDDDRPHCQ